MNFLRYHDRFNPFGINDTVYGISSCFHHYAHGIDMLIFSAFDTTEKTLNVLIKRIQNPLLLKSEIEKTRVISISLHQLHKKLSTDSIIVAPNQILREGNLIASDDTTSLICEFPEKYYMIYILLFIKRELKFCSFKNQLITRFNSHHLTILINLLMSEYGDSFKEGHFESMSGQWTMFKESNNEIIFHNIPRKHTFSIFRNKKGEYLTDQIGTVEIDKAIHQRSRITSIEALHSVFTQCFTSTSLDCETIVSSMSVVKSMPDCFINTLSNSTVVKLKRKHLDLFGVDNCSISGNSSFYETLALSMESMHNFLTHTAYLGELPAPQFASFQLHYDKCWDHEINFYVGVGKMIALTLHDKYACCPNILSTKMIKALFIFTEQDLKIDDNISYEKLKTMMDWSKNSPPDKYRIYVNSMAATSVSKLTEQRRKKIAELLFLLFPDIVYNATFSSKERDATEPSVNKQVITSILLHQWHLCIKNHKQIIMVMDGLIHRCKFSNPSNVISYLKKNKFDNNKLRDKMLKEAKDHIINAITKVYNIFIEPLFLIAWATYLYSKMQYHSLGNKKNSSSNQLHAYISMVGQYDNYFDAIDLRSLPSFLKELKNELGIFDVLGDPFDTKVISKIEETISGFHSYHTLSNNDIDAIIIATSNHIIVQQKREWICEYLKAASSVEREWFFRFTTNTPYVNPNEFLVYVSGSSKLSNSKIIYANSCLNELLAGFSYHMEDTNKDSPHYFLESFEKAKQIFPNIDVIRAAKECFLKDLYESVDSYRNFLNSRFVEMTTNISSGKFVGTKLQQKKTTSTTDLQMHTN